MRIRQVRLRLLLALLVLAAIVPVTLLTVSLLLRFWNDQVQSAEQRNVETARAISVSVEQEIEGAIAALNVMSTFDVFDAWRLSRFQDAALRLVGQRPGWLGLILVDPAGGLLVNTAYPSAVGGTHRPSWASTVASTRRAAVSELFEDPASRQRFVVVAVPVMRNASLQFVLAAQISTTAFANLLARQSAPTEGVISLIDGAKRIIAGTHSEPGMVGKPANPDLVDAATRMDEGAWRAQMPSGAEAYAALSRSPLTGWTVAVTQPSEAIDGPIRHAFWMLAAVGLVVLAAAMTIALSLGRTLIRSLAAVTVATEALARGHSVSSQPSALVEMEQLWGGLREAQAILERRLHERDQADRDRQRALEAERIARETSEKDQGRLAVTLSSIADAVLATDSSGGVTILNEVAQALTGWNESGALGKSIDEVFRLVDEHTREPLESPVARVYREGSAHGGAHPMLIAREGCELPIEYSAAPIHSADGRLLGTVLVFRDATRARETERMREALLAREQQARQDAEQMSQSKDEFVAMISHELRAPLNAIYGWVQLLQGGTLDATQQKRAIEVIERSTRAQTQLIDDLLDMSRIIRGNLRLDLAPTELPAVLHAAIESVRPSAASKKLELQPARIESVTVLADPDRLQQIFANVLVNAIKFTPQGGRIEIGLAREGSEAVVRIADNGLGIEADMLSHIFEPFRQAEAGGGKRSRGGLGIGLALVRHLVQNHGGSVQAASDGAGKGTTFTLRLPALLADASIEEPAAPPPDHAGRMAGLG
ncbi:MAG: PAS domain-containing protein [Betaproteobacteria bacterium]|nr:PAS domain-containing protein [Betaproteobacteria bacterium]